MNVLFISSDNNRTSGAFRCMVQMIDVLQRDHGVKALVVLPKNGDGEELLLQKNIRYTKIYAFSWIIRDHISSIYDLVHNAVKIILQPYNKISIGKLRKLIKRERIELVHVNTSYAHYGAVAAYQCGVKVIWHIREFLEEDQNARILHKKRGYQLINQADQIITVSEALFHKYERYINAEKISKIYDGICIQDYLVDDKNVLCANTVRMVMVGNLSEGKGQRILIESLKNIDVPYQLYFLGDGNRHYLKQLEILIEKYGEEKQIIFCGKVDNVKEYMEKSDIAFICSNSEAFGRVTVEAMLAGCLVIGADSGCTPELIKHERTGLLFHVGDAEDLADKIKYAVEHRELCREIAKRAQSEAVNTYSDVRNADLVYEKYQTMF